MVSWFLYLGHLSGFSWLRNPINPAILTGNSHPSLSLPKQHSRKIEPHKLNASEKRRAARDRFGKTTGPQQNTGDNYFQSAIFPFSIRVVVHPRREFYAPKRINPGNSGRFQFRFLLLCPSYRIACIDAVSISISRKSDDMRPRILPNEFDGRDLGEFLFAKFPLKLTLSLLLCV